MLALPHPDNVRRFGKSCRDQVGPVSAYSEIVLYFFDSRPPKDSGGLMGDVNSLGELFSSVTNLIGNSDAGCCGCYHAALNWKLGLMALVMLPLLSVLLIFIRTASRKDGRLSGKSSNLSAFP